MNSLELVKMTPKQHQMFGELLLYFNGCRLQALGRLKRDPKYLQPIPLQKIYERWRVNNAGKKIVKLAASVFFVQRLRGNYKTGKCSLWDVRQNAHINTQTAEAIQALYNANIEHMKEVRTYMSAKGNEVEIKTVIKFPTAAHATLFQELLAETAKLLEKESD